MHAFKITDNAAVCPSVHRTPEKHSEIIKDEDGTMMTVQIIKPEISPWGVPTVIEKRRVIIPVSIGFSGTQ